MNSLSHNILAQNGLMALPLDKCATNVELSMGNFISVDVSGTLKNFYGFSS